MPPPEALQEKPEDVYPDLLPLWNAWHDLSMSRPTGMSAGGLPWAELSAWCQDNGIDGAARLRSIRLLRAMDATFLMHQAEASSSRRQEAKRDVPGRSRARAQG